MRVLVLLACLSCARSLPEERLPTCGGVIEGRPGPPPRVFGIAAVKLRVSDLAKAQAFYNGFLGFPWRNDTRTTATVEINDRQRIELVVAPLGPDGRLGQIVLATERGGGNTLDPDQHSIAFEKPEPHGAFLPKSHERVATHIAHAGVLVGALGPALEFYRRMRFVETWRGSADGRRLSWVNLRVPDGDEYLELMLYDQRPAPEEMGGKHHVCLFTQNLQYSVAVLEGRRGDYARPIEIKVGRNGKRQANLFDPDGTRVELMEPATADGQVVPPSTAPPPRM